MQVLHGAKTCYLHGRSVCRFCMEQKPVIYMDVVVENCSYIFDTSAIHGGRIQVLHGAKTCVLIQALSLDNIYKSKHSNKNNIDRINRIFQDGQDKPKYYIHFQETPCLRYCEH